MVNSLRTLTFHIITGCAVATALCYRRLALSMGNGKLRPPYRICTPQLIAKQFVTADCVGDPYICAKFGANPSTGGFCANRRIITKNLVFIYLYRFPRKLTYRSDTSTDCRAWCLKRRGLTQGCAFWVSR